MRHCSSLETPSLTPETMSSSMAPQLTSGPTGRPSSNTPLVEFATAVLSPTSLVIKKHKTISLLMLLVCDSEFYIYIYMVVVCVQLSMQNWHWSNHICSRGLRTILMGWTLHQPAPAFFLKLIQERYVIFCMQNWMKGPIIFQYFSYLKNIWFYSPNVHYLPLFFF